MRFSAFQIVQELFSRSHLFRTLLVSNFQEFLELTVGTDHEQPLPPPREVAQKLRKAAIAAVQGWHEKYGEAYKKLSLGYHYLKQNKKVLCVFTALCVFGDCLEEVFKVRKAINVKGDLLEVKRCLQETSQRDRPQPGPVFIGLTVIALT